MSKEGTIHQPGTPRKHPKGLPFLFLTELWERFSYYGITAILILYLSKQIPGGTHEVYAIYGAYGAMVYMTPLFGGFVADRFWGGVRSVLVGAWLIAIGHFVAAVPGPGLEFLFLGLSIIIVGTGLFSPSINSIVGQLYEGDDAMRDGGFTIAYMGRNIGVVIAPIICSAIAGLYSWHAAFVVAGLGMFVGIATFSRGRKYFSPESFVPGQPVTSPVWHALLLPIAFALIGLVYFAMHHPDAVGVVLGVIIVLMIGGLLWLAAREQGLIRRRLYAAMSLTLFYIIFMVLLQQSGGALNLFTDAHVRREIFGFKIEAGMFQSVEPLVLIALSPLYSKMWGSLQRRGTHISDGLKFAVALALMSSSFLLLGGALQLPDSGGKISMWWINGAYFLQAASELFIGPIGLAMVSRLIQRKMIGLYMGVWVLGSAVANFIAAKVGDWMTPTAAELAGQGPKAAFATYAEAFQDLALLGVAAALLLLVLLPWIKRLTSSPDAHV